MYLPMCARSLFKKLRFYHTEDKQFYLLLQLVEGSQYLSTNKQRAWSNLAKRLVFAWPRELFSLVRFQAFTIVPKP